MPRSTSRFTPGLVHALHRFGLTNLSSEEILAYVQLTPERRSAGIDRRARFRPVLVAVPLFVIQMTFFLFLLNLSPNPEGVAPSTAEELLDPARYYGEPGIAHCLADRDFRWKNLSKSDLRGYDLSRACFVDASLDEANLSKADLRCAVLTRASLQLAVFREANLRWANLREANLNGADLNGADLSCAVLTRASLSEADLMEADLFRANLREANLMGADLSRANLREANLMGAELSWVDLSTTDLTDADFNFAIVREQEPTWLDRDAWRTEPIKEDQGELLQRWQIRRRIGATTQPSATATSQPLASETPTTQGVEEPLERE